MISIRKTAFIIGLALSTIRIEKLTNCKDKGPVECSFFLEQYNFYDKEENKTLGADQGLLLKPNANFADKELKELAEELIKEVPADNQTAINIAKTKYRRALQQNYIDANFKTLYVTNKIKLSEHLCKATEKTDVAFNFLNSMIEETTCTGKFKCSGLQGDERSVEAYVAIFEMALLGGVDCLATCPTKEAFKEIKVCAAEEIATKEDPDSEGLSVGAIVGIVLGSLVGVAVIVGLIVFLLKKE